VYRLWVGASDEEPGGSDRPVSGAHTPGRDLWERAGL